MFYYKPCLFLSSRVQLVICNQRVEHYNIIHELYHHYSSFHERVYAGRFHTETIVPFGDMFGRSYML